MHRIDQPVIPQATRCEIRVALRLVLFSDGAGNFGDLLFGGLISFQPGAADIDEHCFGGVGSHRRNSRVRPSEEKPRVETTATHAVVAGPVTTTDEHCVFRNRRIGDSCHHLCAVLRNPAGFCVVTNHVSGGVLQKEQRNATLLTEFNEMCCLKGGLREDDAVVRNDSNEVPVNAGKPSDNRCSPFGFERCKP